MGGVFVKHQVSLKNKKKTEILINVQKKEEELEWKRMTQKRQDVRLFKK